MAMYYRAVLDTPHEDYDAAQEKVITQGYLNETQLENQFPAPDYKVLSGRNFDAVQYHTKTINDRLMDVFKGQTPQVRADFYLVKSAVQNALLDGDTAAAQLIINDTLVPPELASVKQQLLELLAP